MRCRTLVAAALAFSAAACDRSVGIAPAPLQAESDYCDGKALFRVGGILFCADRDAHFRSRIEYSVDGNATGTFSRELDEVLAVAHCLTGRPFDRVADGALKITINNKVEPPGANDANHHDEGSVTLNAHVGAARTGSTRIDATNGRPEAVGESLQSGVWSFLGLSQPKPIAIAETAFPINQAGTTPQAVADGARFCREDQALYRTGLTYFCEPKNAPWPSTLGYAVIGETAGLEDAIERTAAFTSGLTRVALVPSSTPALLIILSERKPTNASMTELLAKSHVTPPSVYALSRVADLGEQYKTGLTEALGRTVGTPIAGVIADWMSTQSSQWDCCDKPTVTSMIGLHNRGRVDTEAQIGLQFLKLLNVSLPSYEVPAACVDGATRP